MENKITAAEKAYDEMADNGVRQLEVAIDKRDVEAALKCFDYSNFDGSKEEKITQDFILQNPVAAFGSVGVKNSTLMGSVMSGQPLCINTRQGRVVFMHGNPDGSILTSQGVAHYTSRAFEKDLAPYIEGQDRIFLISCYPGSRPASWMIGKTKIVNVGNQLRPLTAVVKNGFLAVSYVSKHYQEIAETKLIELVTKLNSIMLSKAAA